MQGVERLYEEVWRMKRFLVLMMVAAVLVVIPAGSAGATTPADVIFEVETSLLGAPSPFIAWGPAVDDGLVCDAGTVVEDTRKVTGFSDNGFNFQGIKHFTCADGSGEFFINMQARIDFRKGVTFQWNVLRGTNAYEDLHGAGSGVGLEICGPDCVFDIYDGGLHID